MSGFLFNKRQAEALANFCFDIAKTSLLGFWGGFLTDNYALRFVAVLVSFLVSVLFLYVGLFFLEEKV